MSLRAEDDRAKLEKKVQEAQRLESLGVLADGIAHDLNNLLASILAHVELARSALPESAAAVHESLCRIEKVAGRAEGICSQILAYAGKGTSSIELVDVNEVIREMTELLKVAVPKSVRLDCQLAADLPPVRANVAQVRQVVMNLIVNAAEAIGAGDAKNGCTRDRRGASVSRLPIPARAWMPTPRTGSSIPSTPRSPPGAAWVWRRCGGSSRNTRATSRSTASPDGERCFACCCPSRAR
jgi:nitrogen-specific signal transduction histidine kinase